MRPSPSCPRPASSALALAAACFARASALVLAALCWLALPAPMIAATPEAGRLLPPETSFLLTTPNFAQAEAAFTNLPMARLWRDPAMRAPADRLERWWREDLLARLDRHWGFSLEELRGLVRGQVIFALLPGTSSDRDWLLVLDCGDRASVLATNLARFRKSWQVNGRGLRTETVQGQEVMILSLPDELIPAEVRSSVATRHDFNESIAPKPPTPRAIATVDQPTPRPGSVRVVQAGSCLVLGNSATALDAVLARLERADLPVLADQAGFARPYAALKKESPLWGWAQAGALLDLLGARAATNALTAEALAGNPQAAVFLAPGLGQLARTVGLGTLQSGTFSLRHNASGTIFELQLSTQGQPPQNLLGALVGPPADLAPPAFVPADAVEFDRIRWLGSQLPTALDQAFEAFSPQFAGTVAFVLDSVNDAARLKDPAFDVREHLRAGMGEELLRWDRWVGDENTTQTLHSVVVLPSPAPERLVAALRAIFVLFPQQDGDAGEREFLTRTIYSVPQPPWPGQAPPNEVRGKLYYAGSPGYVVLSSAESLVEEFLRHGDANPKPLKDRPGLGAARERVLGPGARVAGYWDDTALSKTAWTALKNRPTSGAALMPFLPVPSLLSRTVLEEATIPSLAEGGGLPAFDAVAKYFHLSVYAVRADAEGVTLRYFVLLPPGMERK